MNRREKNIIEAAENEVRWESFIPYIEMLTTLVMFLMLVQSLSTMDEGAKSVRAIKAVEKTTENIALLESSLPSKQRVLSKDDLIVTMKDQAGAIGIWYKDKRLSIKSFGKMIKSTLPAKIVLRAENRMQIGKILPVMLTAQNLSIPISLAFIEEE